MLRVPLLSNMSPLVASSPCGLFGAGLWEMTTSVIQQKRASQRLTPHIKGEIPLYHRSGDKPLDPTTLLWRGLGRNQKTGRTQPSGWFRHTRTGKLMAAMALRALSHRWM